MPAVPSSARLLALSLLLAAPLGAQHRQVRVDLASEPDLQRLQAHAFDVLHVEADGPRGMPAAHLAVDPADEARLRALGIAFDLVHADLEAWYRDRSERELRAALAQDLAPPYGFGSLAGFHTVAEMEAVIDRLHQMHPAIVSARFSIGRTVEGRSIWAFKISDAVNVDEPEPEVYFDAMHHAREPFSMESLLWFAWDLATSYGTDPEATFLVDEREMWFVPCVNPDGYEYNRTSNPQGGGLWRKNRVNNGDGTFGVDLNRNYAYQWGYDNNGSSPSTNSSTYRGPAPFSEPETRAVRDFVLQRQFRCAIQAHTYSDLILWPYGYTTGAYTPHENLFQIVGGNMAATNGWAHGTVWAVLYEANGASIDWFYHDGGGAPLAFTPEIGSQSDGFWPPATRFDALAASILPAYRVLARAAGSEVALVDRTASETRGDGNGYVDPGESMALVVTLENATATTTPPLALTLASNDPHAAIVDGTASLPGLAPGTRSANATDPFAIDVSAQAVGGTALAFELRVDDGQQVATFALSVPIGTPRPIVIEACESERGWSLSAPGDAVRTGAWERAAPQATTNAGATFQPGADHSPQGTQCYVTDGRAGTSAGTYDVDGGPTTLRTPVFDLSGVRDPHVRYWRWFAIATQIDDELQVDLSNDGGATWFPVETVSGTQHRAWNEVRFRVADVAPPTDRMQLRFRTGDEPNNSLLECLIDDLVVEGFGADPALVPWGAPALGGRVSFELGAEAQSGWALILSARPASIPLPGVGTLGVDPATALSLPAGTTDPEGHGALELAIPNDPALGGATAWFQAAVLGSRLRLSNALSVVVGS